MCPQVDFTFRFSRVALALRALNQQVKSSTLREPHCFGSTLAPSAETVGSGLLCLHMCGTQGTPTAVAPAHLLSTYYYCPPIVATFIAQAQAHVGSAAAAEQLRPATLDA